MSLCTFYGRFPYTTEMRGVFPLNAVRTASHLSSSDCPESSRFAPTNMVAPDRSGTSNKTTEGSNKRFKMVDGGTVTCLSVHRQCEIVGLATTEDQRADAQLVKRCHGWLELVILPPTRSSASQRGRNGCSLLERLHFLRRFNFHLQDGLQLKQLKSFPLVVADSGPEDEWLACDVSLSFTQVKRGDQELALKKRQHREEETSRGNDEFGLQDKDVKLDDLWATHTTRNLRRRFNECTN